MDITITGRHVAVTNGLSDYITDRVERMLHRFGREIGVTATVKNNRKGTAKMVIVDLGLPPGFTLMADELEKLVKNQTIEKYSTTGRQIIVYLREVKHGEPVVIRYQLLAKYPLRAQTTK